MGAIILLVLVVVTIVICAKLKEHSDKLARLEKKSGVSKGKKEE